MRKLLFFLLVLVILLNTPGGDVQSQLGGDDPALPPQVIDLYPFPGTEMVTLDPLIVTFQPVNESGERGNYHHF